MTDAVGRLFAGVFGAILIFIVPLTFLFVKQDDAKQTIINDAVVEFVDNARASGEITVTAYQRMMKRIISVQSCDVDVTYSSVYVYPETDSAGNVTGYRQAQRGYSNSEIVEEVYADPNKRFMELKDGGYLSVDVKNNTPTMGTKMLRLFIPGYVGRSISSTYGGYVGNNKQ